MCALFSFSGFFQPTITDDDSDASSHLITLPFTALALPAGCVFTFAHLEF
jgi:hypothetical protein